MPGRVTSSPVFPARQPTAMTTRAAIEAGAVAVLVERRLDVRVPQLVVPSVREAMGPAAAAVHGDPSSRIPVIGVTGTNGKTTTVRLIGDLLEQLGASATEIGTLTGVRTTPEAPELQRVLAEAHRQGHAAVAMEVSSHALDLHRVGRHPLRRRGLHQPRRRPSRFPR